MPMIDPKAVLYEEGRRDALELAGRAKGMDGTAIIDEEEKIPAWREDAVYGAEHVGFPVRDKGQVYTILMPHTPAHNPGSRPENLRAIYSLLHTKDPAKAKPWMRSYGVSGLYKVDECCIYPVGDGREHVFRNLYEGNEFPPLTLNAQDRWEDLGEVSAWQ